VIKDKYVTRLLRAYPAQSEEQLRRTQHIDGASGAEAVLARFHDATADTIGKGIALAVMLDQDECGESPLDASTRRRAEQLFEEIFSDMANAWTQRKMMKLIFNHLTLNGVNSTASAVIPGARPSSQLDTASYFTIQAMFYVRPSQTLSQLPSHLDMLIPGTKLSVHVNFIFEQEIPGTDQTLVNTWPNQNTYRAAFTSMLANMLAHSGFVA
jgi:hypothetical protein